MVELVNGFDMGEDLSNHIMWDEVAILILNCYSEMKHLKTQHKLTLILQFTTTSTFASIVDPDQMASESDPDLHCHSVNEFERKYYMMSSDWLIVRNGCG